MIGISREPRSCVLRQRQERSPLQKLLDYLLKGLEKRDPQQFFAWPVTDHIAPGYSQIIQQPMDFSTMKQKIDENQYSTLSEYIVRSSLWILFPCERILCLKSYTRAVFFSTSDRASKEVRNTREPDLRVT